MRLIVLLAVIAVLVMIVRSRRAVEVWHMAAEQPVEGP
jgi:hypothetical protein